MALSKDVVIRLLGDASSAEKAIKSAAEAAEVSVGAYKRAEREQQKQTKSAVAAAEERARAEEVAAEAMDSAAQTAMASGAIIAAGLAIGAKAAIDWETAWTGVQKTVEGTPEEMDALEESLRNLATTLPATHDEIAGVAEAAGQLGIAREDIVEFTKVAIAMGVSTNLSADEAATGMARMANIMGTASSDVDRMGSALVAVGNAGASTEAEILDMSLRIAAAGRQAGFSEGEVLGLANAMSSLGIQSEAGGTAISTVIKTIGNAVSSGGEELERFANIAGMSSSAFAAAWKDDAAGALTTVVEGLGRMGAEGENVNTVIDDLGLGGIRTSDTLLRLAGDADGLADSLALGNSAWAENNALMNEANKRYDTAAAQIQIAQNSLNDAAIDIGQVLLPIIAGAATMVADFARGWTELPGPLKTVVVILGSVAAVTLMVGGAMAWIAPRIAAARLEMIMLTYSAGAAQRSMGLMGAFILGPWGAALGVASVALIGLTAWLGSSSRASDEAASYTKDLASALRESKGAIDDNIRALAAQRAEATKIDGKSLLEWAQMAGIALPTLTDALLGNRDAYDEVRGALSRLAGDNEISGMSNLSGVSSGMDAVASGSTAAMNALDELVPSMGGAVLENERLAAAEETTGAAAEGTATTMDSLAGAQDDVAATGEDAASAAEKLADAIDALNGPTLNLRDATRGYQEQLDEISEAMKEDDWKKTLDENTEAGRANAQMLDDLATAAMEQANAIAANGGSYDAFRNSLTTSRQALVDSAVAMGMAEDKAWALADQILQIPDEATVDIELPTYQQVTGQLIDVYNKVKNIPPEKWTNIGVVSAEAMRLLESVGYKVRTLPDGTVEVYADTSGAANELNNLVNRRYVTTVFAYVQTIGKVGGRASGGPVWPNEPFWVGEKGPELVQFGANAFVTPADMSAQVTARAAAGATARGPGIPVGAARSSGAAGVLPPPTLNVTVSGAQVTGIMRVDGDGIARMVDGQIVSAVVELADRGAYNG